MKIKLLFITFLLFITIQYQVFAEPNDYIIQFKYNNGTGSSSIGTHIFDEPVNVKSLYYDLDKDKEGGSLTFYNSSNIRIGTINFGRYDRNSIKVVDFYDVKRVDYTKVWMAITTYNLYDYEISLLSIKEKTFNNSTQEIKYSFNKTVNVSENDILFKDSQNNDIPFDYYVSDKNVIIKPKNLLTTGDYKITLFKVTAYDSYYGNQQLNNLDFSFNIDEPLSFIDSVFDKFNNVIKYIFNKGIAVNIEDISFTDESGNKHDFNFNVENNILSIFPYAKSEGRYKVQLKKIFSLDGSEYLDNLPVYNLEITGITLINKNFGTYISSDLQNLILTFDRDIQSAGITLRNNTDDSLMESQLIINGEKLIIDYDSFTENTSYTLTINILNAVDGNTLKNPLVFNFKTVKTTGNGGVDTIFSEFLNIFTEAQNKGIKIVVLAIGIGIIFIISKWLWNKTKLWLKKS